MFVICWYLNITDGDTIKKLSARPTGRVSTTELGFQVLVKFLFKI